LLCSDGLTGVVPAEEIGAVIAVLPPDEATRFLVNLANLRGGPDNITVMIVQLPGGPTGPAPKRPDGPGLLRRLVSGWTRRVPWPFTVLGSGCVLAVLSLVMQSAEVPGSAALFVLAVIAIVTGLTGLIVHFRQEPEQVETVDEGPRTLNVYKRHECPLTRELVDRFVLLESSLADAMKGQKVPADWDAYAKVSAAADAEGKKSDVAAVFRARCRSLLVLSDAFHKARQKEESFRPSWTSPTRAT
jgi:protein phosphatase